MPTRLPERRALVLSAPPMSNALTFFRRRWRGEVTLSVLLWRDMVVFATLLNLFASFGALMLAAQGVDTVWAVAVHFAPTPVNLFLVAAVWRSPQCRRPQAVAAGIWLALMTVA